MFNRNQEELHVPEREILKLDVLWVEEQIVVILQCMYYFLIDFLVLWIWQFKKKKNWRNFFNEMIWRIFFNFGCYSLQEASIHHEFDI